MSRKEHKRFHLRYPSLAFIFCLLFSIVGWFSIRLSENYSKTVEYRVELQQIPDYVSSIEVSDSVFFLTIEMSRFAFLKHSIFNSDKILPISVDKILDARDKRSGVIVSKKELERYITDQHLIYADNIEVQSPDILRFYIKY